MKKSQHRSSRISYSRWLAYATAGAATALAAAPSAEGDIHYSGLLNSKFDKSHGSERKSFRLRDSVRLPFARTTSYSMFNVYMGVLNAPVSNAIRVNLPPPFGNSAERLASGQNVSSGIFRSSDPGNHGVVFATLAEDYFGHCSGEFCGNGEGFVGFRFDVGDGKQYGWARVILKNAPGKRHKFILVDYAYGDPGDAIATGQTSSSSKPLVEAKDASSLGFLALGHLGLRAWREGRMAGGR